VMTMAGEGSAVAVNLARQSLVSGGRGSDLMQTQ
jgi:hypothetical protein